MKQYRKNDWAVFRREIIELDGGVCKKCNRSENDGVILQVHHKEYIRGKLPWEYPYQMCETLCKGCHAEEHGRVPPKSGWEYCGSDDLGDLNGTCELCGTSIRYVFYVSHEKWPTLEVGTLCCDNLTGTETASTLRRKEDRKFTFINSTRWKEDDGAQKITQKKIEIVINTIDTGYRIDMNRVLGKGVHKSLNEAKEKAFEFIDSGKADKFFQRDANDKEM